MRLEITRRADLATRAMLVLAEADHRVKAAELAEILDSTAGFVPQVMSPLVERSWVRSDPGPTGGYALAISLDKVSVLEVMEAVDGPTDPTHCVLEHRECSAANPCMLHGAWSRALRQLIDELAQTPLSQISEGRPSVTRHQHEHRSNG